jgi:hypothetical protein
MEEATSKAKVASFVDDVLAGTGWEVDSIRKRSTRLDPPTYWALFNVNINKEEEERSLRLVAKGALSDDAWDDLAARLARDGNGKICDPLNGLGWPCLFHDTRHAYWFYPYDPAMPRLPVANDPLQMTSVLFGMDDPAQRLSAANRIEIERVRYLPEVAAILRYTIDNGGATSEIYGKAQPGTRGLRAFRVVNGLWEASARYPGLLHLPRPLGFIEELGLLLEEGVPGRPVGGNRAKTEFAMAGLAAADALAVIHESGVEADQVIKIDYELARLERVIDQFAYVLPVGHFLLRDLVTHMRERVRRVEQEDWLPTHGDMKYDQFVYHNDRYTLLDFDYFALAETSYDLGKFCAYLIPSSPEDWRESVAAEDVRADFIRRYREMRPHATLQRFGVYEALQLALRAMAAMWSQSSGWERTAEAFLVLAFERLKSRLPA